jgi:hypothetical protein
MLFLLQEDLMSFMFVSCFPAGGAKVLDGIGKELQLDEHALEPSRAVLHDYGNVSSSTTWYTLGYVESVRGAKKGDRLLQIGVGSGIKCGVNVWRAVRDIHDVQVRGPWSQHGQKHSAGQPRQMHGSLRDKGVCESREEAEERTGQLGVCGVRQKAPAATAQSPTQPATAFVNICADDMCRVSCSCRMLGPTGPQTPQCSGAVAGAAAASAPSWPLPLWCCLQQWPCTLPSRLAC